MANLLARFRRGRTTSLTATSALTSPGPTQQTAPAPAAAQSNAPAVQTPTLERKIHPDLDSLVANWTPPVLVAPASDPASSSSVATPQFATTLRPSTRRHSIDGAASVIRPSLPQPDTHLDDLPEVPIPIPFTAQPQPPTRTRRLITRLTGSSSPPSSMLSAATSTAVGWSTFGRRTSNAGVDSQPHLTDFGEQGRGSPAPSHGTSASQSHPQSRSPSQVNLGTPSTTSQQLEDSVTYSSSGHGHQSTPGSGHGHQSPLGSDLPSPASGFTFGSQGRVSGRASISASPPPPMPPLDHPAFRGTDRIPQSQSQSPSPVHLLQSQRPAKERHARSSSSLPSMYSTSRRKRLRGAGDRTKVQDIFASLSRPASARRRASAEFSSTQAAATALGGSWEANVSREVAFLALAAGGGNEMDGKRERSKAGDSRDGDSKFDARTKRVGGSSSDTQLGEAFAWPDVPAHSTESSSSTMEQKKAGAAQPMPPSLSFTAPTPQGSLAATTRVRSASEGPITVLRPPTPTRSQSDGPTPEKRKADDVEGGGIPSRDADATATFDPRTLNTSNSTSAHAPSSFHRQKRAKLFMAPDQSPSPQPRSATGGSGSGSGSSAHPPSRQHTRQHSRAASLASTLPISALVTPHAPSVARSAGGTAYHMRDPRKPSRVQPTGWALEFGRNRDGGSPAHAWLFFVGFVLFPLWWVAGFCVPVPRTRHLGGGAGAEEKAPVVLDDPQVEFDARSWRRRCRIMAGVSLATYVPFIVLVAVFVPRG